MAHTFPHALSKVGAVFGSIVAGMHESRRLRAEQIIREWRCDENQEDIRTKPLDDAASKPIDADATRLPVPTEFLNRRH
jgi:hypothetical protein